MSENDQALPSVIEYITASGVLIHIIPLSLFTVQAIENKAATTLPYPDEQAYRVQSEVSVTGYLPAEENKEYQVLCKAVDDERVDWVNAAVIDLACAYPQWSNRAEMTGHFREQLEKLRPYVEFTDSGGWLDVLEHCVFTGFVEGTNKGGRQIRVPERHRVINLARQSSNLTLTTPEVVGALRVFRIHIPGATR